MESSTTEKMEDSRTNTDRSVKEEDEETLTKEEHDSTVIKKEYDLDQDTSMVPLSSIPTKPFEIGTDSGFESDSTGATIEHDEPSISIHREVPASHNDSIFRKNLENQYANIIVQTVRNCAQQLKKPENVDQKVKRQLEDKYHIAAIFEGLCVLQQVTSKFCKATNLKKILETIMDPERHFSVLATQTAAKLHEKFENQHWGESSDPTTPQATQPAQAAQPASVGNAGVGSTSSRTRRQTAKSSTDSSKPDGIDVLEFDDDHPVFGKDGVMHGVKVRINPSKNTKSGYFLDKTKAHTPADVIGHNGHTVGDCWPFQICLVRDGIHGSSQGGIYGTKASGAYSIIVCGGSAYADIDDDAGDKLYYSGSGSLDNTDPNEPKATTGTQALQTSAERGQPIRVIRGPNENRVGAPKVGLRYDGLYQVVGQVQKANSKGGAYLVFELEREEDQPVRDKNRPNAEEQKAFRAIRRAIERELR